tara:strand:+ start:166 stop:321 length:156 start_codon:yes stop_codon:yes gene_type:complete
MSTKRQRAIREEETPIFPQAIKSEAVLNAEARIKELTKWIKEREKNESTKK